MKWLLTLVFLQTSTTLAMDLSEYLQTVDQRHHGVLSINESVDVVEDNRVQGDLELTPSLSLAASYTDDKKQPNQLAQFGGYETQTTAYTASLSKKFSTGTLIALAANAYQFNNPGVFIPPEFQLPPGLYFDRYSTSSLGVNFSQSLWKNFFGHATRLRWQRENENSAAQRAQYDLQKKQLLLNAENAYWDYIYALEDVRLYNLALDRAKKIEAWTKNRVSDGISDEADYLQAKALVVQRQLQVQSSGDTFRTARKAIMDFLELREQDAFPDIRGDITARRSLDQIVSGKGRIVQLDSYVASLNARAAQASQREAEDSNRPDLTLQGGYATNGYEQTFGSAVNHIDDPSKPTTTIGIKFTYLFDDDAKTASLTSYRQQALASQLLAERKMLESDSAWSELRRKYSELSDQIASAESLSNVQARRAKAQANKFNKGRSVTTDVVYAEQDSSDADQSLAKLQLAQRKLEASGRLFVVIKE